MDGRRCRRGAGVGSIPAGPPVDSDRRRADFAGSVWISDDQASLRFAEAHGITARDTLDIMRAIVADGDLTAQAAYDLMLDMADADRGLTLPETPRDLL